jgi:hypothetical protein
MAGAVSRATGSITTRASLSPMAAACSIAMKRKSSAVMIRGAAKVSAENRLNVA